MEISLVSIILLVLNTLIPLIVTAVFAHISSKVKKSAEIYEKGKQAIIQEATESIVNEVMKRTEIEDKKLQEQIDGNRAIEVSMMQGLLSVQGRQFKKHCRELLEPGHVITVDEFEEIIIDHDAYNGLGGNHTGDLLFDAVEAKYKAQAAQN